MIEWEGLQPDPSRRWYRHLYGVRGTLWGVRGVYTRDYFMVEECMSEASREHLPGTVYALACVIESELNAALAAPMTDDLKAAWNATFGPDRPSPTVNSTNPQADADG